MHDELQKWLDGGGTRGDYYSLAGLPFLCPHREELIPAIRSAARFVHKYENHADCDKAERARQLGLLLGEADRVFSDDQRWREYDLGLIVALRSEYAAELGPDPNCWRPGDLKRWLMMIMHVHPDRLEEVVARFIPSPASPQTSATEDVALEELPEGPGDNRRSALDGGDRRTRGSNERRTDRAKEKAAGPEAAGGASVALDVPKAVAGTRAAERATVSPDVPKAVPRPGHPPTRPPAHPPSRWFRPPSVPENRPEHSDSAIWWIVGSAGFSVLVFGLIVMLIVVVHRTTSKRSDDAQKSTSKAFEAEQTDVPKTKPRKTGKGATKPPRKKPTVPASRAPSESEDEDAAPPEPADPPSSSSDPGNELPDSNSMEPGDEAKPAPMPRPKSGEL